MEWFRRVGSTLFRICSGLCTDCPREEHRHAILELTWCSTSALSRVHAFWVCPGLGPWLSPGSSPLWRTWPSQGVPGNTAAASRSLCWETLELMNSGGMRTCGSCSLVGSLKGPNNDHFFKDSNSVGFYPAELNRHQNRYSRITIIILEGRVG